MMYPTPGPQKKVMFPHFREDRYDDSYDPSVSSHSYYSEYITKYWPELKGKDVYAIAAFFNIDLSGVHESSSYRTYIMVTTRLEEIRLRLVRDSIAESL